MDILNVGGTLTGGATLIATEAAASGGKSLFTLPGHSRLEVRTLELSTNTDSARGTNPVGRAAVKVVFGNRITEDGCCTVKSGNHIIDLGVRYALTQDVSVLDDCIDVVRAFVFSDEFEAMVKSGVVPRG